MIGLFATRSPPGLNMPCAELKSLELERATDHECRRRRRGAVQARGAPAAPPPQSGPPPQPIPAALPRDAGAEADAGLEHQRRAVAADRELERQVPRRRQRRLGGRDPGLRRHAGGAAARLRHGGHRHGSLRGRRPGRHVRARPSREDRRLRVPCAARHDREVEAAHRRVLRGAARLLVLQGLLDGRPARRDGRAALSRRLRRHHRGRARESARAHAHGRRLSRHPSRAPSRRGDLGSESEARERRGDEAVRHARRRVLEQSASVLVRLRHARVRRRPRPATVA